MAKTEFRLPEIIGLGSIVLLAALLRFHALGAQPIWLDEGYSYWFSRLPLADIWISSRRYDTHPALYYTLLKAWSLLFGDSEAALRSLSVVFGIATVPLVYVLGRVIGGPREGIWIGLGAALLFALSPVQLRFAQEARPYTGLVFGAALALCGIAWLMRHPRAALRPVLGLADMRSGAAYARPIVAAWAALILGTAWSLWLHAMAVFFVLALLLTVLIWWGWQHRWSPVFFGNGLLATLIVTLLWSPHLPVFVGQLSQVFQDIWIQPPSAWALVQAADLIFGLNYLWRVVLLIPLAAVTAFGLWAVWRRRGWPLVLLLVTVTAAPFALEMLVSFALRPLFLSRTLIWTSVPYVVILAAAITLVRRPGPRIALLSLLAALFLAGSVGFLSKYKKEEWDQVADLLASRAGAQDLVLLFPNALELPLSYYLRRQPRDLPYMGFPKAFPAQGLPNPYPSGVAAVPGMTPADLPALREHIKSAETVWLVTRGYDLFDPRAMLLDTLRENRILAAEWAFKRIKIYRFD